MKKTILSITIPTYNRLTFLETAVTCFIDQIKAGHLENDVEVLIGNNDSKDQTKNYVDEVASQHSFIRVFNHPINLGVSGNIDFLVNESRGEYILPCGDDDLFREGALEYYINRIKEKKPNFIINNTANIISNDNSNRDYKVILENRLRIDKDVFVENFQRDYKLLDNVYNWLYLMNCAPSVIFKKDLFVKEATTARKYIRPENLYLWQGQNIIGISKYGRLLVIGKCFALHRKNETHWTKDSRSTAFFNIFDNVEIANLIKDYMPREYIKYKKLYAAFTMGGLMVDTINGKKIRSYAWTAFYQNLSFFPENLQFLSMVIAPRLVSKMSAKLRKYKNTISSIG